MPRAETGQIRVDGAVEELVEQTARNWAAQLQRDVSKKAAAEALLQVGLKHANEAMKLIP